MSLRRLKWKEENESSALVKSCLNCWNDDNEPEQCDSCERMPRSWSDNWLPKES